MAKARGKGGRFTSPSSADAVITVTTVLDGADQVAMGFDEMSDSAREYQHTLADGNKENISFAQGNHVVAESLEDMKKKQKQSTGDQRDAIIVAQGMTSALNQMTGGIYKTIGGLEASGRIGPKTAAAWQKNARAIETLTGPLEVALAFYTGYIALAPVVTSVTTYLTTAKTAETAAVTANTAAWYLNPVFIAGAAIVASLALLIWSISKLTDGFTNLTRVVNAATDAIRFFQEASHNVQKTVGETVDNFVDVITLEPLREGKFGI